MDNVVRLTPIVSVVGQSDSGKTNLLEGIIPELKRRGYRVATVKHDVHDFDIDQPGKDSWRHTQAGADVVMISSPSKWALISQVDHELPLEEIQRLIRGVNIILTEGYSQESAPKIEVLARDSQRPMFQGKNLIALVGEADAEYGMPCFGWDDFVGLADFIEQEFLTQKWRRVMTVVSLLKRSPLFQDLNQQELERIASVIKTENYRKGEVVFDQGQEGGKLYLIKSGCVEVTLSISRFDSRDEKLATVKEGEYFGELSFFDGREHSAKVTALEDLELMVLSREDYNAIISADWEQGAEIQRKIILTVVNLLREMNKRYSYRPFIG